ncbi:MAG: glycosyltransferase, partial [bacterium]
VAGDARGELLFISDADILVEPDTLQLMARWFVDPEVGAVQADHLRYRQDGSPAEGVFDRWESLVRRLEGRLGVMVGPNGWGMMMRRSLYEAIPDNTINDDLELGIRMLKRGCHFLFEPKAIVRSGVEAEKVEFGRRVRFGRGNMQALAWNLDIFRPGTLTAAWALLSHKFLRTLLPFTLVWMPVGAALVLPHPAAVVFLGLLAVVLITTPFAQRVRGAFRKLMLPQYFVLMNAAQLYGGLRHILGFREPYWRRTPRAGDCNEGVR